MKLTLKEIALACNGKLVGDENIIVSSITTDSREVNNGSLFAAIKGNRSDGHQFITQCKEKGAVCALCEDIPETDIPYIQVNSTLTALTQIATYYRSLFSIPFIGITGSVGKTSTKEMIYSVLKEKFIVHKTKGNFNNHLGVPITIFNTPDDAEIAVIEMGISGFDEMNLLSSIVKPDMAVFTNIGNCHLENLNDRDGVFKAKTEMLNFMKPGSKVFYNADDDKLSQLKDNKNITPISYGFDSSYDYFATNIENHLKEGVSASLYIDKEKIDVSIPVIGDFMVANALCAAAIGKSFSMTTDEIKKGIENFENVGSRSRVIETDYITIIDDCYNANPTSVKASIDTLAKFDSRTVAIIGDMKELGESEISLHEETGKYICDKGIELLIAIGPLCKYMSDAYHGSVYFSTIEECIDNLDKLIKKDDTILVKASHSMNFEKIVEKLKDLKL